MDDDDLDRKGPLAAEVYPSGPQFRLGNGMCRAGHFVPRLPWRAFYVPWRAVYVSVQDASIWHMSGGKAFCGFSLAEPVRCVRSEGARLDVFYTNHQHRRWSMVCLIGQLSWH